MFAHKYRPVDSEEDDRDQEMYTVDNEGIFHRITPHKSFFNRCISVPYLLILLLLLTNLATFAFWKSPSATEARSKEAATILNKDIARNGIPTIQTLGPADIPVEFEMREFSTGITEDRRTDFFGEPDEMTNAAWDSLMDGEILSSGPWLLANTKALIISEIDSPQRTTSTISRRTHSSTIRFSRILCRSFGGVSSVALSGSYP